VNLTWGTQSVNERHKQENRRATKSLESIYRWDRSYQLTDEAIYDIWEREDDPRDLAYEFGVLSETIWLIQKNTALVRRDDKLDKELPF